MKYQYKIREDGDWHDVFEGTEEDGFDRIASFLNLDDAEMFVLEKENDGRVGR
jgi:hypothetical protein